MNQRRADIEVEASRVSSRLQEMPLQRIDDAVAESVRAAAQSIVDLTTERQRPTGARLPALAPSGLAAQINVVVTDYLHSTTATSEDAAVVEILTELRRSLP
jgi:hypothetical protein